MATIFTERELRAADTSQRYAKRSRSYGDTTIFLSHSSKDRELALGLVTILHQQGVGVYVDYLDEGVPQPPSADTARHLREKIGEAKLFMLLATRNTDSSRWCPWEVGIGDGMKGENQVYIVPTQDDSGHHHGNEYLNLYQHIAIEHPGSQAVVVDGRRPVYNLKYGGSRPGTTRSGTFADAVRRA